MTTDSYKMGTPAPDFVHQGGADRILSEPVPSGGDVLVIAGGDARFYGADGEDVLILREDVPEGDVLVIAGGDARFHGADGGDVLILREPVAGAADLGIRAGGYDCLLMGEDFYLSPMTLRAPERLDLNEATIASEKVQAATAWENFRTHPTRPRPETRRAGRVWRIR